MPNDGIDKYNETTFDSIKHIDEFDNEYWFARELQKVLEYIDWRNFEKVILLATKACENSKYNVLEHFVEVNKLSNRANNASINIRDYKLSRYACYLIVQNADPNKEIVALGQTYFAIKTREREISEKEYLNMSEEERRFYKRDKTRKANFLLNQVAKKSGVKNYDRFHNEGYKGLYNGETADDIAKRKGLRYREDILDNMGSEELAASEFRITQTEAKLKRDNINTEKDANSIHHLVGKKVRDTIKSLGGTMPENLPTPDKSLKELEKEVKKRLVCHKYFSI